MGRKEKKTYKKQHLKYMREKARKMRESKKYALATRQENESSEIDCMTKPKIGAKQRRHMRQLKYCSKNGIPYAELRNKRRTVLTSTTQHLPFLSQEQQDPNSGCLNVQNVEAGEDIPLELEVFEESNIEESKNKIDYTKENTILFVEIDEGDIEKPKTGDKTATGKLRPLIGGIKINFDNIDKFGEQIAFLLKRLPRQLCRELQDTIVTLVKTATEKHESKTKKNVTAGGCSNTKKVKTAKPPPEISPTLKNNTKHKKRKQLAISEKSIPVLPDVIMREYIHTYTLPKPMAVPTELMGSMDCVKQEVLDPEESCNDVTAQEKHNEAKTTERTLFDPFTTDIKIEETNLIEQAKRRENSQDKYV